MKVVILSLTLISSPAFAGKVPSDAPARFAEITVITGERSPDLETFAKRMPVSDKSRAEILTYIEKQKLQKAKLPAMKWKPGSSEVIFEGSKPPMRIDFRRLPSTNEIMVNGKSLPVAKGATFAAIVERFKAAQRAKSASFIQIIPEAYADDKWDPVGSVIGAVGLVTGLTQLNVCTGGYETAAAQGCIFGSDAHWIKTILDQTNAVMHDFQCEGDKMKRLKITELGILRELDWSHRAEGANSIAVKYEGQPACTIDFHYSKVKTVTNHLEYGDVYCKGKVPNDIRLGISELRPGDFVHSIAASPIPLGRMHECCQRQSCREEMAAEVARVNSYRLKPLPSTPTTN